MAYAVIQDAIDLYGENYVLIAADRDLNGVADEAAMAKAFAHASSEIDSYVCTRYTVPLTTVPEIITRLCIDIALYQASSGPGGGLTDEKRTRYEDAIRWLKDVAKGVASLGVLDASGDSGVDAPEVSYGNGRLFTRTTMGGL